MLDNLTFLFTDLEGSTRLWEQHPDEMSRALADHDTLAREIVTEYGGQIVKARGEGDSLFCVFDDAAKAIRAATALQLRLLSEQWPTPVTLRARMALHSGPAELRLGDFYGPTINRCARLRAAAHGGQIVVSDTTAELATAELATATPDGIELIDMGSHRLPDLARPIGVFQVACADLPSEFPALQSLDVARHNLPFQLTSFVGRDDEIAQIQRALDDGRLVTITGVGGAGKTRLAVQVAALRIDRYAHGAWLVELAPVTEATQVVGTIATALGLREHPGTPLEATLVEHLVTRQLLLIIDNCEHLMDEVSRISAILLERCEGVSVLATSRESLGLVGEAIWRVRSLSLPEGGSLTALTTSGAAQLFVDRARLARPGLVVDDTSAASIAAIVQRLDGIPLAIELAAARAGSLSIASIESMLDDRFRLLTGSPRAKTERHHTMRAAIDWSYRLLDDEERAVLRRTAVFASPFILEGAVAVSGFDTRATLDLLTRLADRSLIVAEPDTSRYRMLETMRAYAREHLDADEAERAHAAHFEWFRDRQRTALQALEAGDDQQRWLRSIEREHEDIFGALAWARAAGRAVDALELATSVGQAWVAQGRSTETEMWLDTLLPESPSASDELKAAVMRRRASVALDRGGHAETARWARAALNLSESAGDEVGVGGALQFLGAASVLAGDFEGSKDIFARALVVFERLGHEAGAGRVLHNLALASYYLGELDEALAAVTREVELNRTLGDRSMLGTALDLFAYVLAARGSDEVALAPRLEALAIRRELGERRSVLGSLSGLGSAYFHLGRYDEASVVLDESLLLAEQMGTIVAAAADLNTLGEIATARAEHESARSFLARARAKYEAIADVPGLCDLHMALSMLDLCDGGVSGARENIRFAIQNATAMVSITQMLITGAWVDARTERFDRAARLFGATKSVAVDAVSVPYREPHARALEATRHALGTEEFERLTDEGCHLDLEQARALFLDDDVAH